LSAEAVNIHEDLIRRCRGGDQEAHFRLYQLYKKSMYNVGYRIVNNEEEAEDVLQEAFISAFRNLAHYRGDATFGAWLKRIVVNKAINFLKKKQLERLPDNEKWDVSDEESIDDLDHFPYTVEQVREAIANLPDGYRAVLSLYLLEGYDHGEIGEILGISESTSKSQFNRSKKKLKAILEGKDL
jgi:RNA polymerase sigma factor (sigma-70 family)